MTIQALIEATTTTPPPTPFVVVTTTIFSSSFLFRVAQQMRVSVKNAKNIFGLRLYQVETPYDHRS